MNPPPLGLGMRLRGSPAQQQGHKQQLVRAVSVTRRSSERRSATTVCVGDHSSSRYARIRRVTGIRMRADSGASFGALPATQKS